MIVYDIWSQQSHATDTVHPWIDLDTLDHAVGLHHLSDQLRLDLQASHRRWPERMVAVVARTNDHRPPQPNHQPVARIAGYAQISNGADADLLELITNPAADAPTPALARDLFDTVVQAHHNLNSPRPLRWWTDETRSALTEHAQRAGFTTERRLHHMSVPLPIGRNANIPTRTFEPETDLGPWLALNNRAFASHGEQGNWTPEHFNLRRREPWFDPHGFRIAEEDGQMIGFCWTKIERDTDDSGEIYVIGIDPNHTGRGLGTQLTLAGLDTITAHGCTTAHLWVDADNTAAIQMYQRLGFAVIATRTAYRNEP